ncbi:hypothetical protein CSA56_16080 [candidate division KSB3 bacterium]|uniref:PEGA domain-containing protein n=1 Tax=candidate division KSB3 bacterium TaxID=2044937 RepID=A0A2G6K8X9_9BACT|nr:MAG: hypothetical protein CSA56_16080 [candidate division KSB3 bacterium]
MQQQDKYEPILYNLPHSQEIRQPKNHFAVFICSLIIVGILTLFAIWYFYLQPTQSTPGVMTTELPENGSSAAVASKVEPTPLPTATPEPAPAIVEATPEPVLEKGFLTLRSSPAGADVLIQGSVIGQTPLQDYELEPGTYSVTFSYNGQTFQQELVITAGEPTEYTHRFQGFASLNITATRSGCDVKINGKPAGRTPLLVEGLSPGSYTIVVSKKGYHTTEKAVNVGKGEHQDIVIMIRRLGTKRQPATVTTDRPLHPSERLRNEL